MKLYIIDSDLYFHFEEGKKKRKDSQIKYKLNRRKYMVMVRVEINEIEKMKKNENSTFHYVKGLILLKNLIISKIEINKREGTSYQ